MARKRPYIGYKTGQMTVISAETTPTKNSHPQFNAVIGPFRTMRAAQYMKNNPQCQSVADAERLSKTPT